jgi:hypothetical protein
MRRRLEAADAGLRQVIAEADRWQVVDDRLRRAAQAAALDDLAYRVMLARRWRRWRRAQRRVENAEPRTR